MNSSRWAFPPFDELPDEDLIAVGADLEPQTLIEAYTSGFFPMPIGRRKTGLVLTGSSGSPVERRAEGESLVATVRSIVHGVGRHGIRAGHPGVRRPGAGQRLDRSRHARRVQQAAPPGIRPQHRGLGWRLARRGALWRVDRRALRWGVDVPSAPPMPRRSRWSHSSNCSVRIPTGLLDVQWLTDHLESLGCREIDRREYGHRLERARQLDPPDIFRPNPEFRETLDR